MFATRMFQLFTMARADERSPRRIGERLRLTREAIGMTQVEFCQRADISPSAYNQYEKGGIRPGIDAASSLCDAHRLTLDWIYHGDPSALRTALWDAIQILRKSRT